MFCEVIFISSELIRIFPNETADYLQRIGFPYDGEDDEPPRSWNFFWEHSDVPLERDEVIAEGKFILTFPTMFISCVSWQRHSRVEMWPDGFRDAALTATEILNELSGNQPPNSRLLPWCAVDGETGWALNRHMPIKCWSSPRVHLSATVYTEWYVRGDKVHDGEVGADWRVDKVGDDRRVFGTYDFVMEVASGHFVGIASCCFIDLLPSISAMSELLTCHLEQRHLKFHAVDSLELIHVAMVMAGARGRESNLWSGQVSPGLSIGAFLSYTQECHNVPLTEALLIEECEVCLDDNALSSRIGAYRKDTNSSMKMIIRPHGEDSNDSMPISMTDDGGCRGLAPTCKVITVKVTVHEVSRQDIYFSQLGHAGRVVSFDLTCRREGNIREILRHIRRRSTFCTISWVAASIEIGGTEVDWKETYATIDFLRQTGDHAAVTFEAEGALHCLTLDFSKQDNDYGPSCNAFAPPESPQDWKPAWLSQRQAHLQRILAEGRRCRVQLASTSTFGGRNYFNVSLREPLGEIDLIEMSLKAMNTNDPGGHSMKDIAKMLISHSADKVALVVFVPPKLRSKVKPLTWLEQALKCRTGIVVRSGRYHGGVAVGYARVDADNGEYPPDVQEQLINASNVFLQSLGLFSDDGYCSDDMLSVDI